MRIDEITSNAKYHKDGCMVVKIWNSKIANSKMTKH